MTEAAWSPLCTAELEGLGGRIGPEPEDFRVVEIPAYPPTGQGDHVFVRIRKRAITSMEAAARLARVAGVPVGEVGMAGMKDRWAVAEQWMSLPGGAASVLGGWSDEVVQVVEMCAHGHKLRTGHLRGNQFSLRIVGARPWEASRSEALCSRLGALGVPNRFGPQRFGRGALNASRGLGLLTGQRGPRDRRTRRLLVSAVQSALFNDYLVARLRWAEPQRPRLGEILMRLPSGGAFPCERPEEDEPRIRAGEVALTGPLFGSRMRSPDPGSEPHGLEEEVLSAAGIRRDLFDGWRRLAPGGRRPLQIRAEGLRVEPLAEEGEVRVEVTLPAGAYATMLLLELTHTPDITRRAGSDPGGPDEGEDEVGLPPGET